MRGATAYHRAGVYFWLQVSGEQGELRHRVCQLLGEGDRETLEAGIGDDPVKPFNLFCKHTIWQPGASEMGNINADDPIHVPLSKSDHCNFQKDV